MPSTKLRNTMIVATIGPASENKETLRSLIQAGLDVARLNFSHGDLKTFEKWIRNIRATADALDKTVPILMDLPGSKIRIGPLKDAEIVLQEGSRFILQTEPILGTEKSAQISYARLPMDVSIGDPIFVGDGHIRLKVIRKSSTEIETEVIIGGKIRAESGINVPESLLSIPTISERDIEILKFGLEHGMDWVAISFVKSPEDVTQVRNYCDAFGKTPMLMAKIERRKALLHLEEIIQSSDGVMVARGDLGVEIPVEQVPLTQKKIISLANRMGKPVITATQMLETMVGQPWPTRAEVADVANAILDGTDAVMLSEETAIGKYPVESVRMMDRILNEIDHEAGKSQLAYCPEENQVSPALEVAQGACRIAKAANASAIATITRTGQTARLLSSVRPSVPIVAIVSDEELGRKLMMFKGVTPLKVDDLESIIRNPESVCQLILKGGQVHSGERVILTGGIPPGESGVTNLIRVLKCE